MHTFSIDFEVTNRCNASCGFCPRDRTPHQGLMSMETFEQGLRRAVEYREQITALLAPDPVLVEVSLCGLGEPLLNKHVVEFARQATAEGFACSFSSNAGLLDERRATALLDAGVQTAYLNVGDVGEAYEAVYQLPWAKTRDNVIRFTELAEGRCEVCLVLVDYKGDREHVRRMREFWGQYGVAAFQEYEIMNRGGSLFVDHMQYERFPERAAAERMLRVDDTPPLCGAPYAYLFIGYDANYYLCCSDWEKKAPVGTVFDESFLEVTGAKLRHTIDRTAVCRTCNLDPINKLTEAIQHAEGGADDPEVLALAEGLRSGSRAIAEALVARVPETGRILAEPARRTLIPVVAET